MRANSSERIGTFDRIRKDGLLRVGACLSGVIAVLYAFGCAPQPQPGQVDTPTFTPTEGTFTASVDVSIACATACATIRYTTDGSDPDGSSTEYAGAIQLTTTTTLKARAFVADMTDSQVASATFTIRVATPTFTPNEGTFTGSVDVSIACATAGATIRYTTDGSIPNSSSTEYTGTIQLPATATLKVRGFKTGMATSTVASTTFSVRVAEPTLTPDGGSFFGSVDVTIACATAGATIRYTTDGSTPTRTHGTVVAGAISLTRSATVKARAYKDGMGISTVGSAAFIVKTTTRVSVKSDGAEATGGSSYSPSMSADGRYVAFQSTATDLVPGDTNSITDVFVHDRDADGNGVLDETGSGKVRTTRVSVTSNGAEATDASRAPSMSADGRYVAFQSFATDLVSGDTNGTWDVFVHDRDTDGDGIFDESGAISTTRVSVQSDGTQATGGPSTDPSISADGRYIAFDGAATNLVPNDTNGNDDVFVHDRDADGNGVFDEAGAGKISTTRISVKTDGTQATNSSYEPSISSDGRSVAFQSFAPNLVPGDTNGDYDIFVHDRDTDGDGIFDEPGAIRTTRVSVTSDGTEATGGSSTKASISSDGRHVAFQSNATDLVAGDTNGGYDAFVHDRDADGNGIFDETGTGKIRTTCVSALLDGTQAPAGFSEIPSISSDGRYVAFESKAADLTSGDTNGTWDVLVHDRDADGDGVFDEVGAISTARASVGSDGTEATAGNSKNANISSTGRYVAFDSWAADLVPGDTNGQQDIFVHDRGE